MNKKISLILILVMYFTNSFAIEISTGDKKKMEEKIQKIMADLFDVPIEEITYESSPSNIKKWDSLNHIKLILSLEEEFNVEIPDEEAEKITTIQQAVDFINSAAE